MQKMILRRSFSVLLILALMVTLFPITQANAVSQSIKVLKDGKAVSFDVDPKVINGRTMVPYQAIAASLGAEVGWDAKAKVVTAEKSGTKVKLTIGHKVVFINDKRIVFDQEPVIVNGRTLVPLRIISESFGLWIDWNNSTKTVAIDSTKTIKHEMGTTKLTKVPQRVVVLFNGMVDISLTLGVKPVGAVESWLQQPWYNYLRAQMSNVKSLGLETQPNVEAIVALKPDLIIGSKLRHEKIYNQLNAIAPTIFTESVFDWKGNMALVAPALNKTDAQTKFMAEWDTSVSEFRKKAGNKLNTEVSIVRFDPDHARIYYTGFAGTILKEIGFARPENQRKDVWGTKLTSKELIPQMDGDIIFDITTDWRADGQTLKTKEDWTSHDLWKNLKGVKNGKFYKVNEITWNMSGGAMAAKMMLEDLYFYFDIEK
jgi:iron complex transport system substrate-binding protein